MKIGLAIAMRREQLGLTQDELASAVGVSKTTISRWESGDISNMRRDRIQKLANALKISPLALLDEETDGLFPDTKENAPDNAAQSAKIEQFAIKADEKSWNEVLNRLSRESKIKLFEHAQLLLQVQDLNDVKDK